MKTKESGECEERKSKRTRVPAIRPKRKDVPLQAIHPSIIPTLNNHYQHGYFAPHQEIGAWKLEGFLSAETTEKRDVFKDKKD